MDPTDTDSANNYEPMPEDDLWAIVYVSTAPILLSTDELENLLAVSNHNNPTLGITGILLYQDGNFMQLIEGPKAAACTLYAKIRESPLHGGIITLLQQPVEERLFAEWAMKFEDISDLTLKEQLVSTSYYDGSLVSEQYVQEPSKSLRLLQSFIDTSRR